MEQLLLKLARQLDAMDEASLTALWDKYAHAVQHFEPSQRWQEAVLVLSLIQAKRWKNQLFNTRWAARTRTGNLDARDAGGAAPSASFTLETPRPKSGKKATVLSFRPEKRAEDPADDQLR